MLGLAYLYRCLSSVTSTLLPFRSPSISQNSIVEGDDDGRVVGGEHGAVEGVARVPLVRLAVRL